MMDKDNLTRQIVKFNILNNAAIFMMPITIIEFIQKFTILRFFSSHRTTNTTNREKKDDLHLIKLCFTVLCLFGIAVIAMLPMLLHNYPVTHSTQFNLSWTFQYQRQFLSGQFYPRWLEFSNFGFGNPTFVFYPPMFVIATLPFSLLGMDCPTSLVGSMVLATFTLALGIYIYASLYFPSWLSLVISSLAVASPYFLIDVYQRGAIAEVWAITFIPWVLLATQKLISQIDLPQMKRTHAISLAIAWGMLGLSHLPTLLISFLAWLPMPLWLLKDQVKTNSLQKYVVEVGRCYLGAILGFVGISFFLLPIIFDQQSVQIESINFSPEYLPQNRLLLNGLLSMHPKFSTHWFETSSGMIPYFWIIFSITIISIFVWVTNHLFFGSTSSSSRLRAVSEPLVYSQPTLDKAIFFWILASTIPLLMTTDLGSWVYQISPTLQKIQFSWRWYGLVVTTIPLLFGSLLWQLWQHIDIIRIGQNSKSDVDFKSVIKPTIIICLVFSLFITSSIYIDKIVLQHTGFNPAIVNRFAILASQKEFPKEPHVEAQGTPILSWHWIFPDGLAIVDVPEYRAKGVTMPMPPQQTHPLAAWQENNLEEHIQIRRWEFGLREILVDNHLTTTEPNKYLSLRMFYYPAWQVWIDGKKVLLEEDSQGQVQISVPSGQHVILAKYVGTQAEQWGRTISYLAIIILAFTFCLIKHKKSESNDFVELPIKSS